MRTKTQMRIKMRPKLNEIIYIHEMIDYILYL